MKQYKPRLDVIDYVRRTLMGPVSGEKEVVKGTPFLRYMTGVLFPKGLLLGNTADEVTATAEDSSEDANDGEEIVDGIGGGVDLASEQLPSAVGLSFKVSDNSTVSCLVWAGRYERMGSGKSGTQRGEYEWQRIPLGTRDSPEIIQVRKGVSSVQIFGGRAKLTVRWRTRPDRKAIITIAIVNEQQADGRGVDPALALFQLGLRCEVMEGIEAYPQLGTNHAPDSEEAEVEYLYRTA